MPERKNATHLHEAITRAWELALSGTPIIYLSGPISTGPRLVREMRRGSGSAEAVDKVRTQNIDDLILRLTDCGNKKTKL